jgi:predicted AAA+ superfamily ATPase
MKNALSQCKIAGMLNISRNNIADYLLYMEEAGMISQLRSKTEGFKQIQNAPKGFVVKDDIEQGYLNVIPLWHFGLLY